MILGNKTLMCPNCRDNPIIIVTRLGWNSLGPTIRIVLSCSNCVWQANKEISLLKMMERNVLCPTSNTPESSSEG